MESVEDSQPFLTKSLADFRSRHIQKNSITYDIGLNVLKGDFLKGCLEIKFTLLESAIVPLDFREDLLLLIVNGKQVLCSEAYEHQKISLKELNVGVNTVYIEFLSRYSYDRCGCKTFTDAAGRQYLITCFEPWEANRLFPNFDQPDLKARFAFHAVIPENWIITSGTNDIEEGKPSQISPKISEYLNRIGGKVHKFETTQLLPTYLFNFGAGEYFKLERSSQKSYKGLNSALYSHQSMAPYLQKHSTLLWQFIDQGLLFYEQFFGYKYPFSKFQVLFFANFPVRAMENPGLNVFEDNYLFKQEVGQQSMVDLGQTFLHEMAHCWFGDLTTMVWWDDLWLNESFADYMGFFCLEKIKHKITAVKYETAMISYFRRKWWGYKEDSYSINHPVRATINNTDEAMSLFDGITYSKGGSILKSIVFLIGQDKFSAACKEYFNKFAWQNTTYRDFMQCLQKQFDIKEFNLNDWSQQWLDTKGHNSLSIKRNGNDKITIVQRCLEHCEVLKNYKINLSLWKNNIKTTYPVIITNTEQVTLQVDGQFFLLNDEDHCFVEVELDDQSFNYFSKNVSKLQNSLTRTMIWTIFYQRIKHGLLTIQDFVKIIIEQLPLENNVSVLQCALEQLSDLLNHYLVHPNPLQEQTYLFLVKLLEKTQNLQKRKIILSCILTTKSEGIFNSFITQNLGDNISQKLQIATVLLEIVPQKHQTIKQILEKQDLTNVAQQYKQFSQIYNISKMNQASRTQYFFTTLLNQSSIFSKGQVFAQCQILKQDTAWHASIFDRYIEQLQNKIMQSQPSRQQYFAFILKGFMFQNISETELSKYKCIQEKVNNRFFFKTILKKVIEDNTKYLSILRKSK